MEEIWKDIEELEGYYQISNFGNTKRKSRKANNPQVLPEKSARQQNNGKGYMQLYVSINRARKMLYIHRLVAKYFIENPKNKPFVNHIDSDRSNNHCTNLEWCTHDENMSHASKFGNLQKGETAWACKLSEQKVLALRRLFRMNPKFHKSNVAKKLGVADSTIHKIINNHRWKHI